MSTITQVERSMLWQKAHPERQAAFNKKAKRKLRQTVLNAYGGKCACCGESRYEFLAIDHMNNDGNERRRTNSAECGSSLIYWLKREGYPEGFQVLCHNCNQAKGWYGECPHTRDIV